MLDYLILKAKPKLRTKDTNEEYLDLLKQTINPNAMNDHFSICVVNKYYVARPDLISLVYFGTDEYADIICKINGISNPFELNENDCIYIPDIETISRLNTGSHTDASELVSDENIESINKQIRTQKLKNERRAPYEQVVGDKNYVIDKTLGLVFY